MTYNSYNSISKIIIMNQGQGVVNEGFPKNPGPNAWVFNHYDYYDDFIHDYDYIIIIVPLSLVISISHYLIIMDK